MYGETVIIYLWSVDLIIVVTCVEIRMGGPTGTIVLYWYKLLVYGTHFPMAGALMSSTLFSISILFEC